MTLGDDREEEVVVGTIHAVQSLGLRYNLIFTQRRIIGDYVGGGGSGLAFALGGVAGLALSSHHQKKKAQGVNYTETPQEILDRHKKNFSIDYLNIVSVILKKKALLLRLDTKIKPHGKDPGFLFSKEQLEDVEAVVMKMLPDITTKSNSIFL